MATVAEQRFLETVPARLAGMEKQLEKINTNLERLTDVITKIWVRG